MSAQWKIKEHFFHFKMLLKNVKWNNSNIFFLSVIIMLRFSKTSLIGVRYAVLSKYLATRKKIAQVIVNLYYWLTTLCSTKNFVAIFICKMTREIHFWSSFCWIGQLFAEVSLYTNFFMIIKLNSLPHYKMVFNPSLEKNLTKTYDMIW